MQAPSREFRAEAGDTAHDVNARIEALRPGCPRPPSLRQDLRDIVVIASSSRGGSSMFAEILRSVRGLLHFRGEINPFFRLSGLSYPEGGTKSDALEPGHLNDPAAVEVLDGALSFDCGSPSRSLRTEGELDRFALDLAARLYLQWPTISFRPSRVRGWLVDALRRLRDAEGWRPGVFEDAQRFHAVFLCRVRAEEPAVNPYFYDLRPSVIDELCPEAQVPEGPPGPAVIEEPPFVTISPWDPPSREDLRTRPLVVKTPSNCYRLDALRALFPNARLRLIHLVRNAASSVNGLFDGWRYRGFFSHPLDGDLEIHGYSDRFPEWGRRWWKFDLPPGWTQHRNVPLEEVCAFQWRSAHEATLGFLARNPDVPCYRLRFEDVVGRKEGRLRAFEGLAAWLGIEMEPGLVEALDGGVPPIMATDQPRHRRWFARAALLDPVLADPRTSDLMERLGYDGDTRGWL